MIRFAIVGSGSKGNATIVYDEKTAFQIDMGVPYSRVREALKSIHKTQKDVEAVFFTHDHSDHIGTMNRIPKGPVFYASEGTLTGDYSVMDVGSTVELGSFKVTSFPVSHDATNPVGYLIENGDESLLYLTDVGYIGDDAMGILKDRTYYIFESNHDYKMLLRSNRPACLKQRIHGDLGHLSNDESSFYLADAVGPRTRHIYLAHLSLECNTPELALSAYARRFKERGIELPVTCAKQYETVYGGDI
jgi:phosphoribosyl 1,2-cyclic phosphodiesterase